MKKKKYVDTAIADRLKELILHVNLPRSDFAERIGLETADQLTSLVNGRVRITKLHAKALKAVFDINEDWLLFGKGKMRHTEVEQPFLQQKTDTAEFTGEFERRKTDKILNNKLARMEKAVFKTQCPGYLDDLFDYIADQYGANKEGTEKFLKDLYKDSSKYRLWQTENKLAKNGCEAIPVEKIKANNI